MRAQLTFQLCVGETSWSQFHRRARACPSPCCVHARPNDRGGQAPALRVEKSPPLHRRARACPSPCNDRGIQRSRGTPARMRVWHPRAPARWAEKSPPPFTVGRGPVLRHRSRARLYRSGSPDPDLLVIRRSQTTAWIYETLSTNLSTLHSEPSVQAQGIHIFLSWKG